MWYHDTERYSLIDNNKLGKNGIVLLSCTICDFLLKILIWKLLYNPIHKIMCGEYLTFILSMCLQTWKNTKIIFIHSNIFVLMAKTKIAIVYHLVLVMVSVCFWNILKLFHINNYFLQNPFLYYRTQNVKKYKYFQSYKAKIWLCRKEKIKFL